MSIIFPTGSCRRQRKEHARRWPRSQSNANIDWNESGLLVSQSKKSPIWEDHLYLNSFSKPEAWNEDHEHEDKKALNQEAENARFSTVSLETQSSPLQTSPMGRRVSKRIHP